MSQREIRFFNTTGPCNPDDHYMLPPAERLVGAQIDRYIVDKLYWVLHAPRQTGKTTFLQNWMREINAMAQTTEAGAIACYVSIDGTLISFLRQLRNGFAGRGVGKFPVSIALVGIR
jgi:hypothetical protein